MPVPGSTVASWTIEREIGRGTTSVVYAVSGPDREAEAALKLALPGTLRDRAAVDRFLRGAEAQRSLVHPGVLPVLDLGTDPVAGPYLVTPLVDGPTLSDALAAGDLPAERTLSALADVAGALDAAAAAGLVHRDVKPSNILLGGDSGLLADFGLARDHEDDPTMTGALAGTLGYLAPELVRGERPTPATDRYAFACVAFQALTGRAVFPRATDAAVLYAHVDDAPPAASSARPELPAALDPVLIGALAKDPAGRPTSATALMDAIVGALGNEGRALLSPPTDRSASVDGDTIAPATAASQAGGQIPAAIDAVIPPARRRPRRLIAGLALGALIAVGAGALVASGDDEPTIDGAAPPAVGRGLVAIGSPLGGDEVIAERDCDGRAPSGSSPACSVSQLSLPGRTLTIPSDGLIRAFTVRGARGPLALQVLRTKDGRTYQVARSKTVDVPDTAPHRFAVELDAEAGDRLALAVTPRTGIGLHRTTGARTERWSAQVSDGSPAGQRTGLDRELLLRGELDPGAVRAAPVQITGAAAAQAPAGREVAASSTRLPDGREVRVALVVINGRVVIDLERGGRRHARLELDGLDPTGRSVEFKAFESPGNDSQLNVGWRNPDSDETVERFFGLGPESLEAYS